MFVQLTDRLIVPHHQILGIYLLPYLPEIGDDDEVETTWGVEVAIPESIIPLFKGDRPEASQHFKMCANYLGQCHQRGLIPLHEVAMMVDPTPLQEEGKPC